MTQSSPASRRRASGAAAEFDGPAFGTPGSRRAIGALARDEIAQALVRVACVLPADLQVAEQDLAAQILWVERACGAEGAPSEFVNGAIATLRRRLVDLVRADVVQQWGLETPASEHMLRTLQRLDRAQRICTPSPEQSFAAELSDHGGLDLVVEVAHDMRSPLTSILFLAENLHRSGQNGSFDDVQRRQIGIIYSAALGLVGMASDMIEMARGGSQLGAREPTPFSVNEMLRSVHDLVRPTAEEKKLDLEISTLLSEHRLGHPTLLSRVLLNLTTNALKFTNEGKVELTAHAVGGPVVRFAVRDTGPGIPESAMDTLYQTFRRAPGRESGYAFSGTGLGLDICRRLVEALGSELRVETRPDWGTRFYFEIALPPASSL